MSDRYDFFYRQLLTEAELDDAFNAMEVADRAMMADAGFAGIMSGLSIAQQIVPAGTVICALGTAYDKTGKRLRVPSNQNVDLTKDFNGTSTAVAGAPNKKILSIFLISDRTLTDPRVDGNSVTVYFNRAETFKLKVVQSNEGVNPTPPSIDSEGILLADVTRTFGQTTFALADISYSRREYQVDIQGGTFEIREGTLLDALRAFLNSYNDHLDGSDGNHQAADILYAGGPNWFDSTTNPATSVEGMLDKIITDLTRSAVGNAGVHKIGAPDRSATSGSDTVTFAAGSLSVQLGYIATYLASILDTYSKKSRDEVISGQKDYTSANGLLYETLAVFLDFASGAVATAASIRINRTSSTYLCLMEFKTSSAQRIRLYLLNGTPATFLVTVNAAWVSGTTWSKDVNAEAVFYEFTNTSLVARRFNSGTSNFTEADLAGRLQVSVPTSGVAGTPKATVLDSDGIITNPGSLSIPFHYRYYEGSGARVSGIFVPFPKRFVGTPTTLGISGTQTNINGGSVSNITMTATVSGVYLEWTSASSGDTEFNVTLTIAP